MSKYSTFKNRTEAEEIVHKNQRSLFISESTSSTEIYHTEADEYKTAVLTKEHREGMDQTLLFTYADEVTPVEQGHYIENDNVKYLVFMEYRHSAEEFYKKYKLVQCNGSIKREGRNDLPAAYFGSLRRFMSLTGTDTDGINFSESTEEPILIVSDRDYLQKDYRFMYMGDIYKVLTTDNKSNPGIAYLSIKEVPYNEVTDTMDSAGTIEKPSTTYSSIALHEGEDAEFSTYRGYIDTDKQVEVISRSSDSVIIRVPYNISELTVYTKDSSGNITDTIYPVVI